MNEIINWMGGWPKDGLVAASEWEERLAEAAESRWSVSENEADAGRMTDAALGEALAVDLLRWRTGGDSEKVIAVSGPDSAIAKLAERALEPGDVVLTQPLTSRFALQAFRKAGLRIEAVDSDSGGMDTDVLRLALKRYRPKLVYAAPSCTDPEGTAWDQDRAMAAADLCREFGALFLGDDRQAFLQYKEQKEGKSNRLLGPGVLSIGQLPPGLVGGVKFGWITGEKADLERWYPVSMRSEIRMSQIERLAMARLLKDLPLSPLIELLRIQCEQRMKRLTELLGQREMPELIWRAPAEAFICG